MTRIVLTNSMSRSQSYLSNPISEYEGIEWHSKGIGALALLSPAAGFLIWEASVNT